MFMSFTIYRKPKGIIELKIGDELLYFGNPWERTCNAILVDDYPTGDVFQIMARRVDTDGKDLGGPAGARDLPAYLHEEFTEKLESSGFVPCYRHNGNKGEIISTSSSDGIQL